MTKLSDLFAADETVTIGGREYELSPLRQVDQRKIEQRILSKRRDPAELVRQLAPEMSPEERREFFERAYTDSLRAQHVTASEFDEFYQSIEGAAFCFWLAIRKHHPEITEDQAGDLLEQFGTETLDEILEKLQAQFEGLEREELIKVAVKQERSVFGELLRKIAGWPSKNCSPPAMMPGTQTSQSPGTATPRS